MRNASKRLVIHAAILGFLLPIIWGGLEFIFFNAHDSVLVRLFYAAAYVTCPPWFIPGFWGDMGSPLLNALLYSVIAYVFSSLRSLRHRNPGIR